MASFEEIFCVPKLRLEAKSIESAPPVPGVGLVPSGFVGPTGTEGSKGSTGLIPVLSPSAKLT